jgi:hypothetical protein
VVLRLLTFWLAWRILRRLIGVAVLITVFVVAVSLLRSPSALEHHTRGLLGQLQHDVQPLVNQASHAVQSALSATTGRQR